MSPLRWRFGRFVLVGLICAAVDTAVVWVLDRQSFLDWRRRHGRDSFAGFLLNYVLHARFTFSVARLGRSASLLRFIAVVSRDQLCDHPRGRRLCCTDMAGAGRGRSRR